MHIFVAVRRHVARLARGLRAPSASIGSKLAATRRRGLSLRGSVEALEGRYPLAANAVYLQPDDARIVVTADDFGVSVEIGAAGSRLHVTLAGAQGSLVREFDLRGIESIHFGGGAGPDRVLNRSPLQLVAWGHGGDDVLTGGSADDILNGGSGDDVLRGGAGNDVLYGGEGNDALHGEEGDDTASGAEGDDRLWGGSGDDLLVGNAGNDQLRGEEGRDRLSGEEGRDALYGGADDDVLNGGADDDLLVGGDGDDQLFGLDGDDQLWGDAGADVLDGGDGNDQLRGGAGGDKLFGGSGHDQLFGELGDDLLLGDDLSLGDDGDDLLEGGEGHDELHGGAGGDVLRGGAGNDLLTGGAGSDALSGDDGDDRLYGNEGFDLLDGGSGNDLLDGGAGINVLQGDAGDDLLYGGSAADALYGGDGNDVLFGQQGNDLLEGGLGDDRLYGADGDDVLAGGAGDDELRGGNGDDALRGGEGNDALYGGFGDDEVLGEEGDDLLAGEDGEDRLDGGTGDDRLYGGSGADLLDGGAGDDLLSGEDGDDVLRGGDGRDQLVGGEGDDALDGEADDDVLQDLFGTNLLLGGAGNDQLLGGSGADWLSGGPGDDRLEGQAGDDWLVGDDGNDALYGGEGIDLLRGGEGDDVLYGGSGSDSLFGDEGRDLLAGEAGHDRLDGGEGNDQLFGGDGNDALEGGDGDDLLAGDAGDDLLFGGNGADRLVGGDGDDRLRGSEGDDVLYGDAGEDRLDGEAGDDALYGGSGNDILSGGTGDDRLAGQAGIDVLYGDDGHDLLAGEEDRDLLFGGDGDDRLVGGGGSDLLVGGAGNDLLIGEAGRDVLVGGSGLDELFGGADDDLLVGGSTAWDDKPLTLFGLLFTWNLPLPAEQRMARLTEPAARTPLAMEETVFHDAAADLLVGDQGSDWFVLTGYSPLFVPHPATPGGPGHAGHGHAGHGHAGHAPAALAAGPGHGEEIAFSERTFLEGFAMVDSLDRMPDADKYEHVLTVVPHASSAALRTEHFAALQLVRYADVTHTAIASGAWSSPATWLGGATPASGARVLIPRGVEVVVDRKTEARLKTVRVDGRLSFAVRGQSELLVDTLLVASGGVLEMGSAANPVAAGAAARLVIADDGPLDRRWDPFGLSRGVISLGTTRMHGASVTPYAQVVALQYVAGSTRINLLQKPAGWRIGDVVAVTAASVNERTELRTIRAIGDDFLLVDPLLDDHALELAGAAVHVAHLSRNVQIVSESRDVSRTGHVMFMHHRDVQIAFAGFNELGRTNKLRPLDPGRVDANWELAAGTGTNERGRYAVHFHINGTIDDGLPSTVRGSVVTNAAGWGFVNHASFVHFVDNVAYGVRGAAFATEVGNEIGLFQGNLAAGTLGSGQGDDDRAALQDFGHRGDGFWFQGAGVRVLGNIAAGNQGSGFSYYTRGFRTATFVVEFSAANVIPEYRDVLGGDAAVPVDFVPIAAFDGNRAYACNTGLTVRYHLRNTPFAVSSRIANAQFWNNETGVALPYTENIALENVTVAHAWNRASLPIIGVSANSGTRNATYRNLQVSGYLQGVDVAMRGYAVVEGGRFQNVSDILVQLAHEAGRSVRIGGNPEFAPLPAGRPEFWRRKFVQLLAVLTPHHDSVEYAFLPQSAVADFGPYDEVSLLYGAQHPDAVPWPAPAPGVPAQYVGRTSRELRESFGRAIGGVLASGDARPLAGIGGLVEPARG